MTLDNLGNVYLGRANLGYKHLVHLADIGQANLAKLAHLYLY